MEDGNINNLYLVYVKPTNTRTNEYSLFFSETPDVVWGLDWDSQIPNIQDDLTPEKSTYERIIHIKSSYPFKTIEEMSCFSMEYAIYGVVALSWIDIENLEEYPEKGRCVLHFGDSIEKVKELLSTYNYDFEN